MKYIPILISLILLSLSVPSFSTAENGTNTIYVDDDNTDGPWDGSYEHPFQFIQDGIDYAPDGDTLLIFDGTYDQGSIHINKSINIKAHQTHPAQKTIILGEPTEFSPITNIWINSNNVSISDLYLVNTSISVKSEDTNDIVISTNTFESSLCISIEFCKNISIIRNTCDGPKTGSTAIYLKECDVVNCANNLISNRMFGIYVVHCKDLFFQGNIFSNMYEGLSISLCNDVEIYQNSFINNSVDASFSTRKLGISKDYNWLENYWSKYLGLGPKWIFGRFPLAGGYLFFPLVHFDRHPAKEPHDIKNTIC